MEALSLAERLLSDRNDTRYVSNNCLHATTSLVVDLKKEIQPTPTKTQKIHPKVKKYCLRKPLKVFEKFLGKSFVKRSNICNPSEKVGCVIVSPCGGYLDLLGDSGERYSTIAVCNANFNGELT